MISENWSLCLGCCVQNAGLDLQVSGFSRIMALFFTLLSDHTLAMTCSSTKWWRGRGEVALPFVPSSRLFPKRVLHQNASF